MKSVWVDFNARVDGYCVVPARRFPDGAAVDEVIKVYDPEDNDTAGTATVARFDAERSRFLLQVDWDSFEEAAEATAGAQVLPFMRSGAPSRLVMAAASAVIFVTGLGAHVIDNKPRRSDALVTHLEPERLVVA